MPREPTGYERMQQQVRRVLCTGMGIERGRREYLRNCLRFSAVALSAYRISAIS